MPIPGRPLSHVALDFVTGVPDSQGKTVILTFEDCFSKAAYFGALPKLPSAFVLSESMVFPLKSSLIRVQS